MRILKPIILKSQKLAIVVPCYNPTKNWIDELVKYYSDIRTELSSRNIHTSLTVVNDGSPKDLKADFVKLSKKLSEIQILEYADNMGKGHALRYGIRHVEADYYIITDNDFPYLCSSMLRLVEAIVDTDQDAIIGIRDEDYYAQIPNKRKWISQILRWTNRHILRLEIDDTQCGLKGFNNKAKKVFLETRVNRFLYDIEFIKLMSRDPSIRLSPQIVYLREQIVLSSVGVGSLASELKDYLKLIFR